MLVGCGSLPKPFAHRGPVSENTLVELPSAGAVRVQLAPSSLPSGVAQPVAAAAVKALTDAGVPASSDALTKSYVLRGEVVVDDPDDAGTGAIQIEWRLLEPNGKPIGKIEQRVAAPSPGSITPLEAAAQDAAKQVAAYFERRAQLATVDGATEAAVPSPEPALYFEGVSGAPGDGNQALGRALTYMLRQAGAPLADSPERATHRLSGRVEATPQGNGMSEVNVVWRLVDRDGQELGKVSQRNPVKSALIEGRWGELALLVSGAAADGVLDAFASVSRPAAGPSPRPPLAVPPK